MREKLIKLLKRTEYQFTMSHSLTVENVADDLIQQGVTIQKHGRWIHVPSSDMMTGKAYKCSECSKMRYGSYMPNYCQCCGAKMDEPKEIPWAGKTSGLTSRESNVGSKFDHASEGSGVTCAENGLVMDENDKTIYDRMKEIAPDDPKWLEGVDHLAAINAILYGLSEN